MTTSISIDLHPIDCYNMRDVTEHQGNLPVLESNCKACFRWTDQTMKDGAGEGGGVTPIPSFPLNGEGERRDEENDKKILIKVHDPEDKELDKKLDGALDLLLGPDEEKPEKEKQVIRKIPNERKKPKDE
jgi:hypothetical protein